MSKPKSRFKPNRKFKVSALSAGVAAALGVVATAPALAQQDGQESVEEIVVTGSYIRRSSFEGAAPIQVLNQEDIARTGATQVVEVLKEFTANSGSQFYNETNSRAGTSMFNIRNLGLGSTLTLLNGKRAGIAAVADDTGTDFLDINQFPISMIERIEVLTDGASATYGSQAVAGVANIITRKGFEGFELSGGYTDSEVIGQKDISFAAGSSFDDGRGSFNVYGTWYEQDDAYRSDFDWLNARLSPTDPTSRFLSSTGSPGTYRGATINVMGNAVPLSVSIPALDDDGMTMMDEDGNVIMRTVSGNRIGDPDCEAAGGVLRSATDGVCRYQFIDQVSVISAEERVQLFTEFEWEFSDTLRYYGEASYSNNVITRASGGSTFNTGQAVGGGFTVLASHPFNFFTLDPSDPEGVDIMYIGPDNWDPTMHTAVDLQVTARPLGREVNKTDRTQYIHRELDYTRFMNGIVLDLNNSWSLDVSYGWAKSTRVTNSPHNYRSDVFQELVKTGEWNPFGTRLSDPTLVSPKDSTQVAGNTDLTLNKFDTPSASNARVLEQVTEAVLVGDLFELGNGGVVQSAFGAQYRDVSIGIFGDSLSSAGESNEESLSGPVTGAADVFALFGELVVPLSDALEMQLAVRREDYGGNIGTTTDPKVSFEYRVSDWLGLRGSWGTSFQAPTVRQTAEATSSAFIDDPASPTGPGGSLVCESTGLNNNIVVAVKGSPDLAPQESENFNFGVVLQLENGLNASFDYFNFDYTDLIASSEGAQAIVNNDCMDDMIPNDPRVTRDAGGQLRQVDTEFVNIGSVETNGFDMNLRYNLDVGAGSLLVDAAATYVLGFDVKDGDDVFDGAGSRNFNNNFSTIPELRGHVGGTYSWGNHTFTGKLRYIGGYTNDQSNNGKVDAWETVDVQYNYFTSDLIRDGGDTRFTFGINNLFANEPPRLTRLDGDGNERPALRPNAGGMISDGLSDRPGYDDRAGHDLRGRIVYLKVTQSF
ncbi:MAG: TonB-dependent receptor plug domain-containing protein [Pseudohongiellaceae bacterium]